MKAMNCNHCNERYTNFHSSKVTLRQPLILKCGHTFCDSCLSQRIEKIHGEQQAFKAKLSCPSCHKITPLLNSIKELPVDVYLMSYIEINQNAKLDFHLGHFSQQCLNKLTKAQASFVSDQKKSTTTCKLCLVNQIVYKCIQCESLLCLDCFHKVHAISAHMEQHKPVLFVTTINTPRMALEAICKEHNRPIEYFCQNDSTSICSRCYILGDHKNHSIVSFEEKNKSILNNIDNEMKNASNVLSILNKVDRKIAQALPNFKEETKSIIESINKSFLTFHALLQAREMELVNSLTMSLKENLSQIEEQRLLLSSEKVLLEQAMRDAKDLIENNALLIDADALLETLKNARKVPCIVVDKSEFEIEQIHWVETNCADLLHSINTVGELKGKQQIKIDFKTFDEVTDYDNDDTESITSVGSALSNHSVGESTHSQGSDKKSIPTSAEEVPEETFKFKGITHVVVKGLPQHVIVTHIRSPNDFYVQLQSSKVQLHTLSNSINSWCHREAAAKSIPSTVAKNMFVLARYSADKMWYRARVISVEESKIKKDLKVIVSYIDFGNEEVVALKDLRKMDKRFSKCPVFAMHCSLIDIAPKHENKPWSIEAVQEFHSMTQNQVFLLSVLKKQDELLEVDLVFMPTENVLDDGFVSVRDILVFLEFGRFKTFSNQALNVSQPPSYQKVDFIQPKAFTTDTVVDVVVTCALSPWDFYVNLKSLDQDYCDATFQHMQGVYNSDITKVYTLYYPRAGNVCCVKGEKNRWFRGKILSSTNNKQATVQFIDTGAIEDVTIDHLKKLHCDFLKLPAQAIHCELFNINPLDKPSKDKADVWFQKNIVVGSEGCIRIVKWEQLAEVCFWIGTETPAIHSESINHKLVELELATKTGSSTAHVQEQPLLSSSVLSTALDEGIHLAEKTLQNQTKNQKFKSVHVSHDKKVHSERDFNSFSGTSRESMTGLPHGLEVDGHSFKKLNKRSSYQKTDPNFLECPKTKSQQEKEKQPSGSPEQVSREAAAACIKVIISAYKSPSDFYIRKVDREEQLKELMDTLQAFYNQYQDESTHIWKANEFCAAKFPDNLWYRCIINTVLSDQEYVITSVDYGHTYEVQRCNIRCLTKLLGTQLECAAVRCHLAELHPACSMDVTKWSNTAIEYMTQEIKDKTLYIKQEGEPTELGLPIDIIMEGETPETAFDPVTHTYHSLRMSIVKQGLAMPAKKSASHAANADLPLNNTTFKIEAEKLFDFNDPNTTLQKTSESWATLSSHSTQETSLANNEVDNSLVCVLNTSEICPDKVELLQVPLPPLPTVGSEMAVVPTYITEDGIIWSQPLSWSQDVLVLCEDLMKLYGLFQQGTNQPPLTWKVGDICVSPFGEDGLWYRAAIRDINEEKAEVFYIDFGNSAWVKLGDLQKIHPHLVEKHRLCYSLKLHDISLFPTPAWEPSTIQDISNLLVSVESNIVVKEIEEATNYIAVDLIRAEDGLNLKDYLVNRGEALCVSDDRHIDAHSRLLGLGFNGISECPRLKFGDMNAMFRAVITHIERPDVIYLQPALVDLQENLCWNKNILEFEALMEKINTVPQQTGQEQGITFKEGQLLEGQYTVDNRWYRAVLVKNYPQSKLCLVTYFDFGTTEVLAHERLRLLHPEALNIPVMAWRCHIPIAPPELCGGKWTQEIYCKINSCLFGKDVVAQVLKVKPKTVFLFCGQDHSDDLVRDLVAKGLAQLTTVGPDVCPVSEGPCIPKPYNIAGIDCQLTEEEIKEVESLARDLSTSLSTDIDEKPFWSIGYENLLTKEQRKDMLVFLAKKLRFNKGNSDQA